MLIAERQVQYNAGQTFSNILLMTLKAEDRVQFDKVLDKFPDLWNGHGRRWLFQYLASTRCHCSLLWLVQQFPMMTIASLYDVYTGNKDAASSGRYGWLRLPQLTFFTTVFGEHCLRVCVRSMFLAPIGLSFIHLFEALYEELIAIERCHAALHTNDRVLESCLAADRPLPILVLAEIARRHALVDILEAATRQ